MQMNLLYMVLVKILHKDKLFQHDKQYNWTLSHQVKTFQQDKELWKALNKE